METAVSTVVLEYARVLAIVLVSLSIGWVLSRMPVAAARRIGPRAELAGAVIIAWMGLARLGWPIQTWGGGSYAEWLNDAIFRWGTIAGLVLLFFEFFRKRRRAM